MRHFIYQDEKSHKFWAVEQQGNELHISWGKVGTKGQSQIKSFSDAAAAAKAELGKPFPQEEELKTKSARLAELDAELNMDQRPVSREKSVEQER